MVNKANLEQCNSYDNNFEAKIASNSLIVKPWNFLKLWDGFIYLAWPFDPIEWVSETDANYAFDNQTNWQKTILYRLPKLNDLYVVNVSNWLVSQNQVWHFFMIDLNQDLDVSTDSYTQWQLRLEEVLNNWEKALVRIVVKGTTPVWPMWPTWMTGAIWATWNQGATGITGATGIQWPTGATWSTWMQWATWPQWPSGIPWIQWPTGATWLKWLQWEWTWNSATSYDLDDAIFYNWNAYVSLQNWNINNTPPAYPSWVDAFWSILAQQGATWPSGLPWPAWWPSGATGATWPQWPQWIQWVAGMAWATGATWPQWAPWPFTAEYLSYYKSTNQDFNVPSLSSTVVLANFVETWTEYLGNSSMIQAGTPKQYIQFVSNGIFDFYQQIKVETIPNAWFNSVTAVRALIVITDSVGNVIDSLTGVCDVKWEDRFDHNVQRTYNLSAYGRAPMQSWYRAYVAVRGSCETVNPWAVRIQWPQTYTWPWLWFYDWSNFWVKKIFSN